MSQENVTVVRLANEPQNGRDMVPTIRAFVEAVADWSDTDAVVSAMANEPTGRHLHPEVEWDTGEQGLLGGQPAI